MNPNPNLNPAGTSWHGTTLQATAQEIYEVMGQSAFSCAKTQYNWFGTTDDGQIFTVYDWKMGQFNPRHKIEWHVGGLSKESTEQAKKEILFHIERVKKMTAYFMQEISKSLI
jgi:hypothetical protein